MEVKITATMSRDGRFWLVHVPEIDQYTQGRNIKEAAEMARDLTATWLDLPLDRIELVGTTVELPAAVREHLAKADEQRRVAERANRTAARESRAAVADLRAAGLTVRDIGAAIGLSHQRVQQLLTSDVVETSST